MTILSWSAWLTHSEQHEGEKVCSGKYWLRSTCITGNDDTQRQSKCEDKGAAGAHEQVVI